MKSAFQGAKVFVTGADGFIGSHLVEALVMAGAHVRGLVYYNSWNSVGWLNELPTDVLASVEVLMGDVRDAEQINAGVNGAGYVFHLASLIGIPYSYEAPRTYIDTNVVGTLNVLQACRNSESLVRVIHTSTSEVYGSAQTVPIREDHPLVGQSPYSASKIAADKIAESFHLSFNLPVVTARPFNTFGPRQTARAVIPTIASQLLAGVRELKLGALSPTRDFNYVTDTVAGFLCLAQCQEAEGKVSNIGTGDEWSIEQTAKLLMQITGREVPIISEEVRIRPPGSEVNRLIADATQIRSLAAWVPKVEFRTGLENTADWISRNLHHFKPQSFAV